MARERKAAVYPGKITTVPLTIRNCALPQIRETVSAVPFVGYHVETLVDGRIICITKPGGKAPFGRMKADDFMVWIYDEKQDTRWRISHDEIKNDIEAKLKANVELASKSVDLLKAVCEGAEPSDHAKDFVQFAVLPGMSLELITKVYKWIWIQEDCNYPTGQGRWLSMNGILELRDEHLPKAAQ